jgi:hypothetical protein
MIKIAYRPSCNSYLFYDPTFLGIILLGTNVENEGAPVEENLILRKTFIFFPQDFLVKKISGSFRTRTSMTKDLS